MVSDAISVTGRIWSGFSRARQVAFAIADPAIAGRADRTVERSFTRLGAALRMASVLLNSIEFKPVLFNRVPERGLRIREVELEFLLPEPAQPLGPTPLSRVLDGRQVQARRS